MGPSRRTALIATLGTATSTPPGRPAEVQEEITFEQELAWSPDGTRIAFAAMSISRALWEKEKYAALEGGQYDLFIVGADGSALRRLTNHPGHDLWLSWSPDGKRIVFGSKRSDNTDLYVINADGTGLTRLTADPVDESGPAWSPDGSRIAFTARGAENGWQLSVMHADGSNRRPLTTSSGNDHNPVWSRDGARIAFCSDREGRGQDAVYLVRGDGTNEQRVTAGLYPGWAPDGSTLVVGMGDGLHAVPLDRSAPIRLAERSQFGRWSPDGTRLAFIAGEFPDTRIYVANFNGTNPIPITR